MSTQHHKRTYSNFSLDAVRKQFSVAIAVQPIWTEPIPDAPPPELLTEILERAMQLALVSEKARSEFIVAPVLLAVRDLLRQQINIYSGIRLDVSPEEGLQGICDFIISRTPPLPMLQAPLLIVLEAKKNDIEVGLGQCASEMIAAQRFNQAEGVPDRPMYGCVTTGELWQFLRLHENVLDIDPQRVYINELGKLLGIFVHIAL